MALRDWLSLKKAREFVSKLDISGFTVSNLLTQNRKNTQRTLKELWSRSIKGEVPADSFIQSLGKTIKTRKRHTLNTLKNIMSAVRGKARSIQSVGRNGLFYNVGVLDSNQTPICSSYMGQTWPKPYSAIPNKPPRISVTYHPCRSYLEFVPKGEKAINQDSFIKQFNNSDEIKKEMLGEARYKAYQTGKLKINSYKDYEKAVLHTIDELGLT